MKDCKLKHKNNGCALSKGACIGEEYCSFPVDSNLETCDYCGSLFLKKDSIITKKEDQIFVYCPQCGNFSGYCPTCFEFNECSFNTDPSPLPRQVRKQVRQGNLVVETLEDNPDRIKITCKNGCKCWDDEYGCCKKNYKTCKNYKEKR